MCAAAAGSPRCSLQRGPLSPQPPTHVAAGPWGSWSLSRPSWARAAGLTGRGCPACPARTVQHKVHRGGRGCGTWSAMWRPTWAQVHLYVGRIARPHIHGLLAARTRIICDGVAPADCKYWKLAGSWSASGRGTMGRPSCWPSAPYSCAGGTCVQRVAGHMPHSAHALCMHVAGCRWSAACRYGGTTCALRSCHVAARAYAAAAITWDGGIRP